MKIKGAMTVLNKRAKFYGKTVEELVEMLDNGLVIFINQNMADDTGETIKVLQAYEVYKMEQGFVWSGMNYETWVKG